MIELQKMRPVMPKKLMRLSLEPFEACCLITLLEGCLDLIPDGEYPRLPEHQQRYIRAVGEIQARLSERLDWEVIPRGKPSRSSTEAHAV
jgi:hypothetical protein